MAEMLRAEELTLLVSLGEDGDGRGQWRAVHATGIISRRPRGVKGAEPGGVARDGKVWVYLFDDAMRGRKAGEALRGDGSDRVFLGLCGPEGWREGDARLLRVVSLERHAHGSKRMWHWKAVCV